ncbi:MAG: amidohydrolase [Gemmatimonadetes bacterium]|nr:amidohydrolase [Gemmatimonadota bacterium]
MALLTPSTGLSAAPALAPQDGHDFVVSHIDDDAQLLAQTAMDIWNLAEVGYQEFESSGLLQTRLEEAGFRVETGIAGIPTAFVAEWGEGGPVIAIMGEFDALPGVTQEAVPERAPRDDVAAGHACGHHLFGAGSVAAARAVKAWLESTGTPGRIRFYGTPAEEGGGGKVYLARGGVFSDVDAMLHWHPDSRNNASPRSSLANKTAKFRFHGVSAHAAVAPERGRSALDGVEAMNMMVNLMREHVPEQARIHYVITSGGSAPNVVPDFAEVYYYVRHPDADVVAELFERLLDTAEGAALGTGTRVEHEVISGVYALLPNDALQQVMHASLMEVGGVSYTEEEAAFARAIQSSFEVAAPPLETAAEVQDYGFLRGGGSTDVGDVSWVVPTGGVRIATWVPGTASHSWQAVAAGGTTIGARGMVVAAKTLALSAVDLFQRPDVLEAARAERLERIGPDYEYRPLIGDREPPLDYRAGSGN